MSLFKYINDKKYFILFYITTMSFVTIMMLVSTNSEHAIKTIMYTNGGCTLLAALYIVLGYYYHTALYKDLKEVVDSENTELFEVIREPRNNQQRLYITLLKKFRENYQNEVQVLHDEKKDYQDFIVSWIHEVKLPITASRLLMNNSDGKTVDYIVDKFEDEIDKIDNYVEQALYYSRIDSFSRDYFITEIQLNQTIKDSVKKYSKIFINKRISFSMFTEEEFVQGDSKWLAFIIDQVMANSLKYTNENGKISVSYEEDHEEKRLTIEDSGIGIKTEDISRVFEKGFTGTKLRGHSKSTGMGLYFAKQMCLKLGYDISIESEEDEYTKVTIRFPKIRNIFM